MTPSVPPGSAADDGQLRRMSRRIQWMIGGRLVVALLLIGSMIFTAIERERFGEFTPSFVVVVTLCAFALSLGCAIALIRTRSHRRNALVQLGGDLALTTALIFVTGGAGSVLTFLYGITILVAGLVVGVRALVVTSIAALVLYGLVTGGLSSGWLPPPPDQTTIQYQLQGAELRFAILSNLIGLSLVALLAGNLSARLARIGLSEAQLRRLNADIIRSIRAGIITTNLAGRIVTINQAGADILGIDPSAIYHQGLDRYFPIEIGLASSPSSRERQQGTGTRADGTAFPVGFTATPLLDEDGVVTGRLVSFQDLTEITELRAAARRAEQLAVLGRLAANLAHEIRNPLGSICGSVELVREAPALGEEDRNLLANVVREVDRLNSLVTDMLEIASPKKPSQENIDLVEIARGVVEVATRGAADTKDVAIEFEASTRSLIGYVDAEQIRQVLWNLLKNAIQASPVGSTVTLVVREASNHDRLLEILDRGEGIQAGSEQKIFDAFHSERPQGVGLGLALTKQIVDAHGGRIEVDSSPQRGSCFRVVLPE